MSLKTWIKLITIVTALLTSIAMVTNSFKGGKVEETPVSISTLVPLEKSQEMINKDILEVTVKPKEKIHKFKIKVDFEYQFDVKAVNSQNVIVKAPPVNIEVIEQIEVDRTSFNQINLLWDLYCSEVNNLECKE